MAGVGLEASFYMLKVINDLFNVFQIEEGHFGYNFEKLNVIELVEKIVSKTKEVCVGLGLKLILQKPDEPIEINADSQRLSTALLNILDNAVKYNVKSRKLF